VTRVLNHGRDESKFMMAVAVNLSLLLSVYFVPHANDYNRGGVSAGLHEWVSWTVRWLGA
jgi:hypothetical protein